MDVNCQDELVLDVHFEFSSIPSPATNLNWADDIEEVQEEVELLRTVDTIANVLELPQALSPTQAQLVLPTFECDELQPSLNMLNQNSPFEFPIQEIVLECSEEFNDLSMKTETGSATGGSFLSFFGYINVAPQPDFVLNQLPVAEKILRWFGHPGQQDPLNESGPEIPSMWYEGHIWRHKGIETYERGASPVIQENRDYCDQRKIEMRKLQNKAKRLSPSHFLPEDVHIKVTSNLDGKCGKGYLGRCYFAISEPLIKQQPKIRLITKSFSAAKTGMEARYHCILAMIDWIDEEWPESPISILCSPNRADIVMKLF